MKIRIFQLNPDSELVSAAFCSYREFARQQGSEMINGRSYDLVFEGNCDAGNLEEVYREFVLNPPPGFKGRPLHVADVIEVIRGREDAPGYYYLERLGFTPVSFDARESRVRTTTWLSGRKSRKKTVAAHVRPAL